MSKNSFLCGSIVSLVTVSLTLTGCQKPEEPPPMKIEPVSETLDVVSERQYGEWSDVSAGDATSLISMGICNFVGEPVEKDEAKAKELFTKAKELKSKEAALILKFLDAKPDEAKVAEWKKAAEGGDREAAYMVALAMVFGQGIEVNRFQAQVQLLKVGGDSEENGYPVLVYWIRNLMTMRQYGEARRIATGK